jgi:ABC-type transporter Mla subunit MlaD
VIRRLATALVLVGAVLVAVVLSGAGGGDTGSKKFKVAFDNAFGLTKGGDLRFGGVKAGSTSGFELSKGKECQNPGSKGPPRTCALVKAEITQPGFRSLRTDATCAIRQQSLIGEYYVDCQPGQRRTELKSNAIIPVYRTQSTIPTDLVNNILRRPYRDRLRIILAELGTGLAGRPRDLAEVLERAHPGLQATRKTLKILGDQADVIKNFIRDSDVVVQQLDAKKQEVARWITETGRTAAISATRRDAIAAGFRLLPTFLDELKPTMQRLGELADAQTPLLRELQRAAPSLTEFFTRLGPFANASRPAFRSLGSAADAGRVAFRNSADEVQELRRLAIDAPGLAKPLRQLLQTSDDAKRAVDLDPRAKDSAPPAPDVNSNENNGGARKGFTGMESLLNYLFWQTLAINEFDDISHMLRVAAYVLPDCSNIQNDLRGPDMNHDPGKQAYAAEQEAIRKKCNSFLGPYQPGITAPDPTDPDGGFLSGSAKKSAARALKPTAAKKAGERRGAGQPRALPLPGQVDPSRPQVVLPPSVQALLDRLRRGLPLPKGTRLPDIPGLPRGAAPDQMLDFLLSP